MLDHAHNPSTSTIYAAIELSKKSWVVAILRPERDQPSIHRIKCGALSELISKLRAAACNAERLLVCYEAGYDGFWLARALEGVGIACRVLDPASLQVNRRARRVKTDRIDVLMLVRAIVAVDRGDRHVCSVVRVPTMQEEDARRSHRERQRLVRERTAHINRIKGLLFGQGIRGVEPARKRTRIDLSELRTGEGLPLPDRLRAELEREYTRFDLVEQQLESRSRTRHGGRARPDCRTKTRDAHTVARRRAGERGDSRPRDFCTPVRNRRQLGSYLGLTPSAYDSGSTTRCQGISKPGNSFAWRVMIEVAWLWRKYQPESALAKWYERSRAAGQSPRIRRIMLIALARKLIVALWRYVEIGLVPEVLAARAQKKPAA